MTAGRMRTALAALIASAALGFGIGAAVERSGSESGESTAAAEPAASHVEAAESGGGEAVTSGEQGHSESGGEGETLLGVDLESTPLVALAIAASLLLAAAVYLRPQHRDLLVLIALAMLGFAVLDVREVVHQADESRGDVAAIAAVVAVFHLGAFGLALVARRRAGAARIPLEA